LRLTRQVSKVFLSMLLGLIGICNHQMALSDQLIDPTQPKSGWETSATSSGSAATESKGEAQRLRLQQLIRVGKTWTAVINGQAYQAGDESKAFKVISITEQAATIQLGKQEQQLMLESSEVSITESRALGSGSRDE
jgi:uncharacterized protein YfaP (DUF2135 family)